MQRSDTTTKQLLAAFSKDLEGINFSSVVNNHKRRLEFLYEMIEKIEQFKKHIAEEVSAENRWIIEERTNYEKEHGNTVDASALTIKDDETDFLRHMLIIDKSLKTLEKNMKEAIKEISGTVKTISMLDLSRELDNFEQDSDPCHDPDPSPDFGSDPSPANETSPETNITRRFI